MLASARKLNILSATLWLQYSGLTWSLLPAFSGHLPLQGLGLFWQKGFLSSLFNVRVVDDLIKPLCLSVWIFKPKKGYFFKSVFVKPEYPAWSVSRLRLKRLIHWWEFFDFCVFIFTIQIFSIPIFKVLPKHLPSNKSSCIVLISACKLIWCHMLKMAQN